VAKTTRIERSEAANYLRKATQFLAEADAAATANRPDAAMLCAIHAAISAADAVTVGLSQLRSTDPNHAAAADLLRAAGRGAEEFEARAKQLSALIQKKNLVEYEGRGAKVADAEDACKLARRIVEWSATIFKDTKTR
jgi:HEPN domain-containing protein